MGKQITDFLSALVLYIIILIKFLIKAGNQSIHEN